MRFFSDDEYKYILAGQEDRISRFYDLWTLKESYIKYVGKGLSIPLDSFSFIIEKDKIILTSNPSPIVYFRQFFIGQAYKLSVCSEENKFADRIQIEDINNIFRS